MEEIDKIILFSLKNINCELDEHLTSLKDFDTNNFVKAITCCLNIITPELTLPKMLPISMSQRLKFATSLAECIKDIGFRGDIGYQLILYGNENEMRKILMFLVEHLPRETDKQAHPQGEHSELLSEIKTALTTALKNEWVPSEYLSLGSRICGNTIYKQDFKDSYPLHTINLTVPKIVSTANTDETKYWNTSLPCIYKQCSSNELVPSVLFSQKHNLLQLKVSSEAISTESASDVPSLPEDKVSFASTTTNIPNPERLGKVESTDCTMDNLKENILKNKSIILQAKEQLSALESRKSQLDDNLVIETQHLEQIKQNIKIKSKMDIILSSEENISKLESMIEASREKLLDLARQWSSIQTPLLFEYKEALRLQNSQNSEIREKEMQLISQKKKLTVIENECKIKDDLQGTLAAELLKLKKSVHRSAYTRRILEIIGNIKKQKEEINKMLEDTKMLQKETNSLSQQIDRAFTLADEIIFQNAKTDEMSRKSYKLLASLHTECGEVIQLVTELGVLERETRNLQDQVEVEESRETSAKLERVKADLIQIKKETALLVKKNKF